MLHHVQSCINIASAVSSPWVSVHGSVVVSSAERIWKHRHQVRFLPNMITSKYHDNQKIIYASYNLITKFLTIKTSLRLRVQKPFMHRPNQCWRWYYFYHFVSCWFVWRCWNDYWTFLYTFRCWLPFHCIMYAHDMLGGQQRRHKWVKVCLAACFHLLHAHQEKGWQRKLPFPSTKWEKWELGRHTVLPSIANPKRQFLLIIELLLIVKSESNWPLKATGDFLSV